MTANRTSIAWTTLTLNTAVGCSWRGPECDGCYAALDARRRADNPMFPMYEGVISEPGVEDVATGGGEFAPLDQKEIDALCERLNFDDVGDECFSSMAARLARRDRKPGDESYVSAAQARSRDGELEVDQGAYVSRMNEGADGAFVMAWLWVSDDEAGLSRCAECGEAYSVGGDGYDGRCPDCADARENEG